MTLYQPRPMTNALQRVMSSFKQFEKKLDKLQNDVSRHGQTLGELRNLVSNLSTGNVGNPDTNVEKLKHNPKKTTATAIQYETNYFTEDVIKTRRKNAVQPLPSKLKAKSMPKMANEGRNTSKLHNAKGLVKKLSNKIVRQSKAEAPRKATTLRKGVEKKRSKLTN